MATGAYYNMNPGKGVGRERVCQWPACSYLIDGISLQTVGVEIVQPVGTRKEQMTRVEIETKTEHFILY